MEVTRNVLVIAYYFPPMGLSGVQRTAKFVKYLPQFGWRPTVLTVAPTGYYAMDESLLHEVEEAGAEIVRASSIDPNRVFKNKRVVKMPSETMRKVFQFVGDTIFIPDTKIGWKRKALKAAEDLFKHRQFDLIFATAPPQTDFLVGEALKKKYGVPLALDYRDAWLDYPFKYYPTPLHKYANYRLEKSVLKTSDRIVVTLRRVKESILKRYPGLHYNDVVIIPQGYDPDDFEVDGSRPRRDRLRMRITHAGTFYAGRNPVTMLRALHSIFDKSPHLRGRIELNLLGNARDEDRRFVTQLGLQNDVTFAGYLEHKECTSELVDSDVLWLVLDNDFQSPGKLYEYIGARKPLLASVVDGNIKQLIVETKAGTILPLKDVSAHEKAIRDLFRSFERNELKQIDGQFSQRYNRRLLTGELAKEFESLMDLDKHSIVRMEERAA